MRPRLCLYLLELLNRICKAVKESVGYLLKVQSYRNSCLETCEVLSHIMEVQVEGDIECHLSSF